MKKHKQLLTSVLLGAVFMLGIGILIYPTFSSWWNSRAQSRAIARYDEAVSRLDDTEKKEIFAKAQQYNEELSKLSLPLSQYEDISGYEDVLDITGTGIMGYITIPRINVYLPVYHGTSPEVLNIAVGHLQGTSLPVGGTGRHSVISAHRGLPSSRLFTDIDKLVEDDTFTITILDEVLTYSVDSTQTILPTDMNKLAPVENKDLVTLMTCTPYGVNTHRLLVTAHRTDNEEVHNVRVPADAVSIDKSLAIPYIIGIVALLLIIFWFIEGRISRHSGLAEKYSADRDFSLTDRNDTSK